MQRTIHLLACEFTVQLNCAELGSWLDAALPHAKQDYPPSARYRWSAMRASTGYVLDCGADGPFAAASVELAGEHLVSRMHDVAFAAFSGQTKIHAGCADFAGRRLLVVGRGRAGKTTLMIRLLYEGFAVQGDEMVIVRDGRVVSYPRRFGVRHPTLNLIPQIANLAPAWARVPSAADYQVFAFDPVEAGFPWRIREARVDDVVHLSRSSDGTSEIAPCGRHEMAHHLMVHSTAPSGGGRQWIDDVCAILPAARCFILTIGDLDRAVDLLRTALIDPVSSALPSRGDL